MAKVNDWSQLPHDLIGSITNRLGAIEDFVAFSSVCTSWRSALREQNWAKCCVPWLLLCKPDSSLKYRHYFLIPSKNKKKNKYNVEEPLITNAKRCWGSAIGWVFTLARDNTTRLINPLTGVQITLPTLTKSIERALVFHNGTDNNKNSNIVVMVIYDYKDKNRLAFARPGFGEWITLDDQEDGGFADVACYKDKIFGVRANGALMICKVDGLVPRVTNFVPPLELVNFKDVRSVYLIESEGDLLMAMIRVKFSVKKEAFEVYRFDMDTRSWAELDDLGDRALFLGDNYSISVFPTNGVDCIGNCIYFSSQMGLIIFYMKDKRPVVYSFPYFSEEYICYVSTDYLSTLLNPWNWPAPVWVMPNL